MFFMASPSLKNVNRAMKDAHKTNSFVRYSSLRSETNIWPGAWVIKRCDKTLLFMGRTIEKFPL